MSREKGAALLLLLLTAVSAWNIRAADRLCSRIETQLKQTEYSAQVENWDAASYAMEQAMKIWLNAEGYTHIFIRHAEIDSCSDVFYDCMAASLSKNREELSANLAKLRYHLNSISEMERVTLGNIF